MTGRNIVYKPNDVAVLILNRFFDLVGLAHIFLFHLSSVYFESMHLLYPYGKLSTALALCAFQVFTTMETTKSSGMEIEVSGC